MAPISKRNQDGYYLSYEKLLELGKQGQVHLGVYNNISQRMARIPECPKRVRSANMLWICVAAILLIGGAVLSYFHQWYVILMGMFLASIIYCANRKANSENVVNAAYTHKDYYEKGLLMDAWLYQFYDEADIPPSESKPEQK